jgi:CheY-like chemotaxis protein
LHRGGEKPLVLIDLIMPKMDGSGVLGGLELLDLLHNNFKDLQLLVMTDYHHADAEKKVRDCDCRYLLKPRRAELGNTEIMAAFLARLSDEFQRALPDSEPDTWQDRFNLGDELRIEMGEDDDMPRAADPSQQNSGLSLLRGMLEELSNPELQGGVLLLVLRFASEFMNRAIVFTVNDSLISGAGQFGIAGGLQSGDERVRAINLPTDALSIFSEPYRTGQAATFTPELSPLDSHLFDQLGGGIPEEVFIGPLVSRSRVIGFLYGDNLPEKTPIGDTESLAIFLVQAGIAMEKSLLERQLNERATL